MIDDRSARQGVHLRVVGVSDSKSLVVASDVFTKEFNDNLLSEICRLKADRSSLSTLISGFGGNPLVLYCWGYNRLLILFISHAFAFLLILYQRWMPSVSRFWFERKVIRNCISSGYINRFVFVTITISPAFILLLKHWLVVQSIEVSCLFLEFSDSYHSFTSSKVISSLVFCLILQQVWPLLIALPVLRLLKY